MRGSADQHDQNKESEDVSDKDMDQHNRDRGSGAATDKVDECEAVSPDSLQKKCRHSVFALSKFGGPPHRQHSSCSSLLSVSIISRRFPVVACTLVMSVISLAPLSNGSQNNEL